MFNWRIQKERVLRVIQIMILDKRFNRQFKDVARFYLWKKNLNFTFIQSLNNSLLVMKMITIF